MSTSMRYLIGLTLVLLAAAGAAVAVRGQEFTTRQLYGEPWPVAVAADSPLSQILEIDANAQDEIVVTLLDGRLMRITAEGQSRFEALGNARSKAVKAAFAPSERRWIISRTEAMLLDGTGREVRTISVPRRATASLVLSDGNLAFLTPRGRTLVSVINQFGSPTAEFGDPVEMSSASVAQRAWLNEATLLETTGNDIIVVFSHLPYPTVRRYSRTGKLLGEIILRTPGIDRIAAAATERMREIPSTCSGGLATVFGVAYDRVSDTIWLTSASDDGVGFVRVLNHDGNTIAQTQFKAAGNAEPVVPTSMVFGGNSLFWVSGQQIYRTDVSAIRHTMRRSFLARLVSRFVPTVHADKILHHHAAPPSL